MIDISVLWLKFYFSLAECPIFLLISDLKIWDSSRESFLYCHHLFGWKYTNIAGQIRFFSKEQSLHLRHTHEFSVDEWVVFKLFITSFSTCTCKWALFIVLSLISASKKVSSDLPQENERWRGIPYQTFRWSRLLSDSRSQFNRVGRMRRIPFTLLIRTPTGHEKFGHNDQFANVWSRFANVWCQFANAYKSVRQRLKYVLKKIWNVVANITRERKCHLLM